MVIEENLIAQLTARTSRKFVPSYTCLVRELAGSLGFADEDASKLELVTEEACLNVIDHAFAGDENSFFSISLEKRPGQLVIAIEDQGLPFDWAKAERGEGIGLGLTIMKAFLDQIRYLNLGREGKRVELIRNLPADYPAAAHFLDTQPGLEAAQQPAADVPLSIRLMQPDEGVDLARCFYHCYGYSYFDFVYHPEKIRELIEQRLQTSIVAVTADGEIVGHFGMSRETSDCRVAETGQAVVNPRFRGRGLFETMKEKAAEHARAEGYYGFYSESVTIHPYTQKGNLKLGAGETGILLSYAPQRISFKNIDASVRNRQTTVLFYLRLNDEPERRVYPPDCHRAMVEKIYRRVALRRIIADVPAAGIAEPCQRSSVEVRVVPDLGVAFLRVHDFGLDLRDLVRTHLRELCGNRIDCIYLDLPLADPMTCRSCPDMEGLGFSFSGIIPEIFNGDVLRLQYLNNITVDAGEVVLASDFGRELFDYVLRCHEASTV
ncbi:MAG: GNAT family N-acetyltransferase [Geobacteraceae bacterium]|nr:GNAT family N-acetyltransferase [Geobacteraceae bacterium]